MRGRQQPFVWRLLPVLVLLMAIVFALTLTLRPEEADVIAAVDFQKVEHYLERAAAAYWDESKIRASYPDVVYVGSPADTDVLYFLEQQSEQGRQWVTVRGTDNWKNAIEDAEYLRHSDSELGIAVHRGFDADAQAIYADLKPRLNPDYVTCLTGHSLGAAVSTLLMMYLHQDGFQLAESINFGQPKVTNAAGVKRYEALPLLRIVDGRDVVPLLPADTVLDSMGGEYAHLGQEVILLDGPYFVYLSQARAEGASRASFWRDLGEESLQAHKVTHYRERVTAKFRQPTAVSFEERYQYLSRD